MNLMLQLCFSVELEVRDPDYYQGFQLPILPPAFLKGSIEKEVMIKSSWIRQSVIEAVPGASRLNLPPHKPQPSTAGCRPCPHLWEQKGRWDVGEGDL